VRGSHRIWRGGGETDTIIFRAPKPQAPSRRLSRSLSAPPACASLSHRNPRRIRWDRQSIGRRSAARRA
jgi:hypothetical protein